MNALEMLLQRVSAGQSLARGLPDRPPLPGITDYEGEPRPRQPIQALPPGLPLVVQDQIRNQPSYGEGGVMPGPRNPLMEQEAAAGAFNAPQREQPLAEALGIADFLKHHDVWPMPEGAFPPAVGRQNSPYATRLPSALNQLMRRLPVGQY